MTFIKNKIKTNLKIGTWIYLVIFSLIAAKTLSITPFSLIENNIFLSSIIGLLIVLAIFIVSTLGVVLLEEIKWERKKTPVKINRLLLYMIPPILISTFVWLSNWPGIVPFDSAYMIDMAINSAFNNMHPIVYVLYVTKLITLWRSPVIFILIQIVFCSFVFAYAGYAFEKQGLKRAYSWVIVCLLSLIPVNVINSITWLKDISYIMALVFMSIVFMEVASNEKFQKRKIIALIVAGLIAMLSRHNGLLTIPLSMAFAGFIYLLNKDWRKVIYFALACMIVIVGFFGFEKLAVYTIRDDYSPKSNANEFVLIPSGQLAYIATIHWEELSEEQLENAEFYMNMGYINHIRSTSPETWAFNFNYYSSMKSTNVTTYWKRFIKFYLSLVKDFPQTALVGYEKLTAIAWCAPEYGYTVARNHGITIYDETRPIATANPIILGMKDILNKFYLRENDKTVIFWRPAIWMLLSFYLLLIAYRRHGKKALLVISPAVFNMLGYMIICPSQCVRYLYCNVSVFIIMTFYTLMIDVSIETGSNRGDAS